MIRLPGMFNQSRYENDWIEGATPKFIAIQKIIKNSNLLIGLHLPPALAGG
jgi:hypothetical protein